MNAIVDIPPRRLVVVGTTGSGKSALARRIGDALDIAVVELDELYWLPGWRPRPTAEFRAAIATAVAEPAWIVAGNYRATWDLTWPRAELVVWLDYSFPRILLRLACRSARRAWTREHACNGNVETWRRLLGRDSIIAWLFKTYASNRHRYGAILADSSSWPGLRFVRLAHPRDAEALVARWRAASRQ